MGKTEVMKLLDFVPTFIKNKFKKMWIDYDEEADVLYLNFKKPSKPDDSEMTEDDIIIRYENKEIIGITILNASKRTP